MKRLNTVFLIDDDPACIFINTQILQKAGINGSHIVTANNGLDGLRSLVRSNSRTDHVFSDLVFLDINMPVIDGFEFIVLFKEMDFLNKDNVRIVILTSSPNPADIEKTQTLGIKDYVEKPLTLEKVKELIAA